MICCSNDYLIYLFISAVPGKPSRPEIQNITETTIGLAWKAPYDDGGDSVKKYVVQYKVSLAYIINKVTEV